MGHGDHGDMKAANLCESLYIALLLCWLGDDVLALGGSSVAMVGAGKVLRPMPSRGVSQTVIQSHSQNCGRQ